MVDSSEKLHQDIMKTVAVALGQTPLVLKGGTALLLAYGLDRHSVDLDYDSPKHLNLQNRLDKVLGSAGLDEYSLNLRKNTHSTTRFKIHYQRGKVHGLLKIEVKNNKPIRSVDCKRTDGFKVYTPDALCQMKIDACLGRDSVRDLYDLGFIVGHFGGELRSKTLRQLKTLTRDKNALVDRYRASWKREATVNHRSLTDVVSGLSSSIKSLARHGDLER